jgi:hypothetical protein
MIDKGCTQGNPITLTCFICRRYLDKDDEQIRRTTAWWCKHCKMPLCPVDRSAGGNGREQTCIDEQLDTDDEDFACIELHSRGKCVPKAKFIKLPNIICPIVRQIRLITQTTPRTPMIAFSPTTQSIHSTPTTRSTTSMTRSTQVTRATQSNSRP